MTDEILEPRFSRIELSERITQAALLGARAWHKADGVLPRMAQAFGLTLLEWNDSGLNQPVLNAGSNTILYNNRIYRDHWPWGVLARLFERATESIWTQLPSPDKELQRDILSVSATLGAMIFGCGSPALLGDRNAREWQWSEWHLSPEQAEIVEQIVLSAGDGLSIRLKECRQQLESERARRAALAADELDAAQPRGSQMRSYVLLPREVDRLLRDGILAIDPRPVFDLDADDPWIDLSLGSTGEIWGEAIEHYDGVGGGVSAPADTRKMTIQFSADRPYLLRPGWSMNAHMLHHIALPANIEGTLDGRSRFAQMGLSVAKAGQFKAGWSGVGILELTYVGPGPLELYPGMPIAQMRFTRLR